MSETKQFKLVYENAGELKGSYTGIPADDDTDVIKRAVLEGKEDPAPTPEPEPVDPSPIIDAVTYDFGIANWSDEWNAYVCSIEPEAFIKIVDLAGTDNISFPFKVTIKNEQEDIESTHVIISYYGLYSMEDQYMLYNMQDVLVDDPDLTVQTTFDRLAVESAAETGDSAVCLFLREIE